MSNNSAQKLILLDTDIGSDVDDSLALAYLLKQPRAKIIGVTTVSGEPHKRAAIVDCIIRQCGLPDIPVHVGIEAPLLIAPHQPKTPHYDVLAADPVKFPHREFENKPTAIDFLRETIIQNPGEITLLAIGPLTNIALLFKVDPEIPLLLKQLVIMGGQNTGWAQGSKALAEWNILCDPHAASIVFASEAKITAVGYEITTHCRLNAQKCREELTKSNVPNVLMPMAEQWLGHQKHVTFHDPLAAALIFEPDLCELEGGTIEVETASERASGLIYWNNDATVSKHRAASSVNVDAFFKHYFEILTA